MPLNVWFTLFAPRGVPEAVTRLLSARLNQALADPALVARAFEAGALVKPASPQEVTARLERETAGWVEVVRAAGITAG